MTRDATMPTLGEALREAVAALAAGGGTSPRLDAELLLSEAAGVTRSALIAWPERPLGATERELFRRLIERRRDGEPVAYLLGRREFWGLELLVTAETLIPRPDTELLVECALAALPATSPLVCADLGTGSGAVAAALARERPAWTLLGVERFTGAAAVAAANARRLGLPNLSILRGDWLAAVAARSLDAVVANPPYVRDDDPHARRGDLRFEPKTSLLAGDDGLDAIRIIARQAPHRLRPGGWIGIEHGWDQGPPVRRLLRESGLTAVATHRDLAGHERATTGSLP